VADNVLIDYGIFIGRFSLFSDCVTLMMNALLTVGGCFPIDIASHPTILESTATLQ
jgi:hypothetical protein